MMQDTNFSIKKNEVNTTYNMNPSLKINYNIISKAQYEKSNLMYTKNIQKPDITTISSID